MSIKIHYSRIILLTFCILAPVLILFVGCNSYPVKQKIIFNKYPDLKLGFTTQNFIKCVPVTLENAKKFVDYASDQGYHWIELRDPDAVLTLDECKQIAAHAKSKAIEIGYANQRGFLDPDFFEVFAKGVKNAIVFEGTKTIRALASGQGFAKDENKKGFTEDEFKILVANANKAAKISGEIGLQLVVENGSEALKGDMLTYYGLTGFFKNVDPDVGWQFDTANFFSGSKVHTDPEDAKVFLEKNANNLFYLHLKASKDAQAQPYLVDNELDFEEIFSIVAQHNVNYIAIELFAIDDEKEVYRNHVKSIEYLKNKGFISF